MNALPKFRIFCSFQKQGYGGSKDRLKLFLKVKASLSGEVLMREALGSLSYDWLAHWQLKGIIAWVKTTGLRKVRIFCTTDTATMVLIL